MQARKRVMMAFGILSFVLISFTYSSDKPTPIPEVQIQDLNGQAVSTSKFHNNGKPYLIMFWTTWNKNAVYGLGEIAESYEELQKETGMKLIAISMDDARNKSKVKPFVEGKEWGYENYLDPSNAFKSALSAEVIPTTYVVNSRNEIVWSMENYEMGDIDKIVEALKAAN